MATNAEVARSGTRVASIKRTNGKTTKSKLTFFVSDLGYDERLRARDVAHPET